LYIGLHVNRGVTVRSPHDMIRTVNFSNDSVYYGMIQYSLTAAYILQFLSDNEFVASITAIIMWLSTILNECRQYEAYLYTIKTSAAW